MLQSATALTLNIDSWKRIAVAQKRNVKPAKIINFYCCRPRCRLQLRFLGCHWLRLTHYKYLYIGYCAGEYDRPLIRQYSGKSKLSLRAICRTLLCWDKWLRESEPSVQAFEVGVE